MRLFGIGEVLVNLERPVQAEVLRARIDHLLPDRDEWRQARPVILRGSPISGWRCPRGAASERGQRLEVLARRRWRLADGTPALEDVNLLGTGTVGKSRKLFVVTKRRGIVIDAETYLDAWDELASEFEQIIRSFAVDGKE